MLAVSSLNTISSLISKALSDVSISDQEYSLILLKFERFTRMKEELRIKSKTSLEKTDNTEIEASFLFNRNTTTIPTWTDVENHVQNHVQNHVSNRVQNHVQTRVRNCVRNRVQNRVQNHIRNCARNHVRQIKKIRNKTCHF